MDQPPETKPTLLEQLDQRQNEVLDELDALNERIESVLNAWQHDDELPVALDDAA